MGKVGNKVVLLATVLYMARGAPIYKLGVRHGAT